MIITGVDPGKTGAMVTLFEDGSTIVDRVPLLSLPPKPGRKSKGSAPDWERWSTLWRSSIEFNGPDVFILENVHGWKGQAAGASFAFGKSTGFALATILCSGVPIHHPPAVSWKIKLGLVSLDKNESRKLARKLIPSLERHVTRAMDDGVAEAGLLAYYGLMTISG